MNNQQQSPGRRLRNLLAEPGILVCPGIYDGFSARLVEQMGFTTAAISGAGLSEARLGWADVGIMGYDETVHASAAIAACTSLPLPADGDTGYGNAVNVHFTVRGFERAGLACLMIEDHVWPKRCGHMAGKQVISAEEGAEKIRAAAEARRDPDFMIKARTDATASHGVAEAIRRLAAQEEADAFTAADPGGAADAYVRASGLKAPRDELLEMLADKENGFGPAPNGSMTYASFRAQAGVLKARPAAWTEMFIPSLSSRDGS